MAWQDVVYAIGQWVFIAALLPSVFSKNKPAVTTSLMTGGVIFIYALTFISLNLWLSVVSSLGTAVVWFILAFQKYQLDRKTKG